MSKERRQAIYWFWVTVLWGVVTITWNHDILKIVGGIAIGAGASGLWWLWRLRIKFPDIFD